MLLLIAATLLLPPQDPSPQEPPPRIEWQRTLADALAVQQATGKPLLVCVNQDGEVFCERFATVTYHDPAFVAATRGYVCVIASPDNHTERDYDGLGRRVECPRFPGVTCAEHRNIEPGLYARWFDGRRTAPRHIAVQPDGRKLFDRFLDSSMQTAIDLVQQHKGDAAVTALPPTPEALLRRRDARARAALEARYLLGDRIARVHLLGLAAAAESEPFDLLRMGLRDDDPAVFGTAAQALARTATAEALVDLRDALARCDDDELAARLAAAVERIAADSVPARQFAAHRNAVLAALQRVRAEPFAAVRRVPAADLDQPDRDALEGALDAAERAVRQAPEPRHLLALAQANLAMARFLAAAGDSTAPLYYEDARRAVDRAAKALADGPRPPELDGILAVVHWQQGDGASARRHCAAALLTMAALGAAFDATPQWVAECCAAGGRAAFQAFLAALQQDPLAVQPELVEQAALPFLVLAGHPHATPADLQQAAAMLSASGGERLARVTLRLGIERFPWSRELHQDYRQRLLADCGAEALRARYAEFAAGDADRATAEWFAGYAALVAAEQHVRDQRPDAALAAYTDCIERFERSARQNEDYADSARHFAVLALANRALLHHLTGDGEAAVRDLTAAHGLRPASMTDTDGLGRRPDAILRRIDKELRAQGKVELAEALPRLQ